MMTPLPSLDLNDVLTQLTQRAAELIPFDRGGIALYDTTSQTLSLRFSHPVDTLALDGLVKLSAERRAFVTIDDFSALNEPQFARMDGLRSGIASPIQFGSMFFGVFVAESTSPDAYTDLHSKILSTLSEQAALALHAAQLNGMLLERVERLTDSSEELLLRNEVSRLSASDQPLDVLLPQMVKYVAALIDADACALTLWDSTERRPQRLTAYGVDLGDYLSARNRPETNASLTQTIVQTSQPVILNDAQRIQNPPSPLIQEYEVQAMLAMPLVARGQPIGAAFLMNLRNSEPFTMTHAEQVSAMLDQIALTIENRLLLQDMQYRLSETSALLEIAARAASSLNLQEMLGHVLKLTRQMLGVSVGAFFLYNRYANTLELAVDGHFGMPPETGELRFPVNAPGSHMAIVFTSGAPYFSNDVRRSTQDTQGDYAELLLRLGLHNLMLAPLRVQDEPMGVFFVGSKPGDFTRADSQLLMAMGSHVAASLRNSELLNDTRQRLRETEALQKIAAITSSTLDPDEMLERTVQEAANLIDAEGAILMMPDMEQNALVPHTRARYGIARKMPFEPLPLDQSVTGHILLVYRTGRAYTNRRAPIEPGMSWRNVITFPLSTRNRVLGTLSLINRKSGEFEDGHIELARTVASQIATSIENAQLFAAERQRADLMALVNRISQELTATLSLSELTRKVVKAIHERLRYERVNIYLLDDAGLNLIVRSSVATSPDYVLPEGRTVSIMEGMIGRAMREAETQIVVGAGTDLAVPLRYGARILGIIEAHAPHPRKLDQTDSLALETLAAQVSIAIENARLWDQARRRLLEQGIVHQIGQDLTAILDYNELVNAIVKHMTRALDTALCLLASYNAETGEITYEAEYRLPELPETTATALFNGQKIGDNEQALIVRAINTRRQVIVTRESIGESDSSRSFNAQQQRYFEQSGIYAQLALPMISGDRVIGCVLWIETRGQHEFSGGDIRLAQTLTTQAAIAIENARLFRQAQRQAHEQTLLRRIAIGLSIMPDVRSLLEQAAYEVTQALAVNNVAIATRRATDPLHLSAYNLSSCVADDLLLSYLIEHPEPSQTLMNLLESGALLPLHGGMEGIPEEIVTYFKNRPVSVLLTPIMRRRKEIIGIIEVSIDHPAYVFQANDLQLLEALANQIGIAYDNIGYHEREQRRLRQMEKLQVSNQNIAGQLRTSVLLDTIVAEAAHVFDAPAVSLMIREPETNTYQIRASVGLSERYVKNRRPPYYDAANFRVIGADEASQGFTDSEQADLFVAEGISNFLVVPLIKAGQQLGALVIYAKDQPRVFNEEEKELVLLFAGQAAIGLENSMLYEASEDRAVELAKANRLKSEFLARVSHELRTPMNSINVFSEMLLRNAYGTVNEKQADRIERILRNGKNLLSLIDDLLDISKIDAGKMELLIEAVNLRDEVAQDISNLESQATARGLSLKMDVPESVPLVRADSMRLRQIITNLLGNALKFTKHGGVTVRVRVLEEGTQRYVATSVIDTGIGIRKEDQTIIFDEFRQADGSTTREYGGTGLGLAITKKLVEMMLGKIWVESSIGVGSTFTFTLPVAQPNSEVNKPIAASVN